MPDDPLAVPAVRAPTRPEPAPEPPAAPRHRAGPLLPLMMIAAMPGPALLSPAVPLRLQMQIARRAATLRLRRAPENDRAAAALCSPWNPIPVARFFWACRETKGIVMESATPPAIETEGVDMIPRLRAYARVLTRDPNDADDLVQETLLKALSNIQSFLRGTMLRAWLFTIMHTTFCPNVRKRAREKPGAEDCVSGFLTVQPDHDRHIHGKRMRTAIENLPGHDREILILVVMLGESCQAAATLCGVAVGTVKSRVNRARKPVMDAMGPDALRDLIAP
jgi:RNA polymerase sigma-70 factor (ECF subfamily)